MNFKEDRKQEINFLSKELKDGNVIVEGERGNGKTSIIKEATKQNRFSRSEIDLTSISKKEFENLKIFNALSFRGKISFLWSKMLNHLFLIVLPGLSAIYAILGFFLSQLNFSSTTSSWIVVFTPLILVFLYFIIIFILFLTFKKYKKTLVVHISEWNFLNGKIDPYDYIHKIIVIYSKLKNPRIRYVLESTDNIDAHIVSKLEATRIKVTTNSSFTSYINDMISDLEKHSIKKEYHEINKAHIEYLREHGDILIKLYSFFSYREIITLTKKFAKRYKYFLGELNFVDFLIVNLLEKQEAEFMKVLIDNITAKEDYFLKSSEKASANDEWWNLNKDKIKSHDIKSILEDRNLFRNRFSGTIISHKKVEAPFPMSDKTYITNYLDHTIYSFLFGELVGLFKNNPIAFVNKISKNYDAITKFPFKYFSSENISEFLGELIVRNDEIESQRVGFFGKSSIRVIIEQIYLSIRFDDKNSFIKKLKPNEKILFVPYYIREVQIGRGLKIKNYLDGLEVFKKNSDNYNLLYYFDGKLTNKYGKETFELYKENYYIRFLLENGKYQLIKNRFYIKNQSIIGKDAGSYSYWFIKSDFSQGVKNLLIKRIKASENKYTILSSKNKQFYIMDSNENKEMQNHILKEVNH